ncbi:MAG: Ig-like domain-containing protein [Muribaculaceae bacterium]|nr:Ig-like domain-containing protein [Muribaculaceae bacterium]
MKKKLLFLFALAATTLAGSAKDAIIDFTPEGDVYGLTRQSSFRVATNDITWSQSLEFTAEGVEVVCKNTGTESATTGFALVKATDTGANYEAYNGLAYTGGYGATSQTVPEITLSVPNGTISKVVFKVAGGQLITTSGAYLLAFNGVDVTPVKVKETGSNLVVSYTYEPAEPQEKVVVTPGTGASKFYARFINSIDVTYASSGSSLEEPKLSFNTSDVTGFAGQEFVSPTLVNPANLPVTWSSTNEAVATVDEEGKVTLVGKGTTNIVASFGGNDKYEDGTARYALTVWGTADNATQIDALIPKMNDKVFINFPITVAFSQGVSVYGTDPEGNAVYFMYTAPEGESIEDGDIIYEIGNVIPAGWIGKNGNNRDIILEGSPSKDDLETVEVVYPVVETIDYLADKNRVVTLKNVEFRQTFQTGDYIMNGYVDGKTYSFQNKYNIEVGAGLYDMVVIVNYTTVTSAGRNIAPIKITPVPASYEVSLSVEGLTVEESNDEATGRTITISGMTTEDTVTVTLAVPEGFDGFLCMNMNDFQGGEHQEFKARKAAEEEIWANKAEMLAYPGIKESNSTTFNVGEDDQEAQFYLVKGDKVLNIPVAVTSNVEKDTNTAVEGIEAAEFAEYFNLQGVKVATPENGVYVKVVNGKASKVIVK